MMSLTTTPFELGLRRQFRHYTRRVYAEPSNHFYHHKRLLVASKFVQLEPLQGALADYFFACWYDMAKEGRTALEVAEQRLPKHILSGFELYVNTGEHLPKISPLATRFSVLASPSLNVPKHQLFVSKDDATLMAKALKDALLDAKADNNTALIAMLEDEFLAHCAACQDHMSFMMAWLALSRAGWEFSEAWRVQKIAFSADGKE